MLVVVSVAVPPPVMLVVVSVAVPPPVVRVVVSVPVPPPVMLVVVSVDHIFRGNFPHKFEEAEPSIRCHTGCVKVITMRRKGDEKLLENIRPKHLNFQFAPFDPGEVDLLQFDGFDDLAGHSQLAVKVIHQELVDQLVGGGFGFEATLVELFHKIPVVIRGPVGSESVVHF